MLRLPGTELRLCDSTTRRTVLRLGGLGMLSLAGGMPNGHPAVAASNSRGATAKHVVFFSLYGGPAHQDMFDLKPEAPADIRGEFSAIETSVPGVWISEYLPRLARLAHRYTLIRSMTHSDNGHGSALYTLVTGWPHPQPNSGADPSPTDYPAYGTVMSSVQPPRAAVPPYVMVGGVMATGAGQNGGLLGPSRSPLVIERNADSPNFEVPGFSLPPDLPEIRLSRRRGLLDQVNAWTGSVEKQAARGAFSEQQQRAFEMLCGSEVRAGFDIEREAAPMRRRYGLSAVGQNLLLVRRLVEAGVPVLHVAFDPTAVWDTHGNNFNALKGSLLPQFDRGLAAFLGDLDERGLLEQTMVVVCGEFGRTPRVNADGGRDHWAGCYTALVAGGGLPGGMVYGTSDAAAAYPLADPVGPWDLGATVLVRAGIDPATEIRDLQDRPLRICRGEPILDLI